MPIDGGAPVHTRIIAMLLVPTLAITLSACRYSAGITFIPEGGSYSAEELASKLETSDLGAIAEQPVSDATTVRQQALARLREHGDEAASLADTLTREFPFDVAAVPVIVERGDYDGTDAWFVVEAWGEPGGTLSFRRIWVFSARDLSVLAASTAR
jgi:hypothetical protein